MNSFQSTFLKKIHFHVLTVILILTCHLVHAQKESNIWCFGVNVGLDFNSGSPVFFPGSGMNQYEGCTSIADTGGNLLFYSDGLSVWNSNHFIMPNGFGLMGGNSSAQSALIVKQPGNPGIYYIFTTPDMGGPAGFNYSTVDMSLQGGLGDVVLKNINLLDVCDERLTAARHANGTDVWIIATSSSGDSIHSFHLSATGINNTPFTSYNGLTHTGIYDQIGTMKTSINGDYLGVAINSEPEGHFELYNFDIANGSATLVVDMAHTDYKYAYGIEFSPSGDIMYGTAYGTGYYVFQFDLLAGSPAAIEASALLIATSSTYSASLQLAPDGKIYMAKWFEYALAAIQDPDQLGLACNYTDVAISFPNQCNGGLPNFYPGLYLLDPMALFTAPHHVCPGTCTDFTNLSSNATTYLWTFPGGTPSTSTDVHPTVCYLTPGNYNVSLTASNSNGSSSIMLPNYVTVFPYSPSQSIFQNGDTLVSNQGFLSYQWFYGGDTISGATDYFYIALQSGDYSVICTDENGCFVEAVLLNVIAGIEENSWSNGELMIFPNPSGRNQEITVTGLIRGTENADLAVYNMVGEKVIVIFSRTSGRMQQTVDISSLAQGVYAVELVAGDQILRTKFVKQ